MKRARSASRERPATDNDDAKSTEQTEQTLHISLQQIMTLCDVLDNEDAGKIFLAAKALQRCNRKELRALCIAWDVNRTHAGGRKERPVHVLKAELHAKLAKRVRELQEKKICDSASEQKPHTSVPSFCFASTTRSMLQELQQIPNRHTLLARVIDHARYSEDSISHAVVKMLRQAEMQVLANLAADQPMDACGYIASDAVQQLRQLSLAEADSWWNTRLPDYSTVDCIARGQSVLQCEHRILDSHEVNRLVREYCNIADRPQAAEEWWAGAIALDHFLQGLCHSAREILEPSGRSQHRWRAWIVNTQSSQQAGSHWFTVALGVQQTQKEEMPQGRSATQRPPESALHHPLRPQTSETTTSTIGSMAVDGVQRAQEEVKLPAVAHQLPVTSIP